MQIRKTLPEISDMLQKQSGKQITVKQTAPNEIGANYLVNIDMTLIGHGADHLLFKYHLGWGASLLAKSASGLFGNIKTKKLSIDMEKQTIQINLSVFGEFKDILKTHKITAAQIEQTVLVVDLIAK